LSLPFGLFQRFSLGKPALALGLLLLLAAASSACQRRTAVWRWIAPAGIG
jgi:hypothetical protein